MSGSAEDETKDERASQVAHYMRQGFDPRQVQELLEISEDELRDLIRHHFGNHKSAP